MKIQFFRATKNVTDSCFLLFANGKNILIECEVFSVNGKKKEK
jgi:metallo-beta-lactamase family protein